jgi:hypothetical protein
MKVTWRQPSPRLAAFVGRARAAGERLLRRAVPAPVAMLDLLSAGWLAQAIVAAAELGLADALGDESESAEEIAARLQLNPDGTRRLLRALAQHGIFRQQADGRFAASPLSNTLRRAHRDSIRDFALFLGSPTHREHWSWLSRAVARGESAIPALRGMSFFAYAREHATLGTEFAAAMSNLSALSRDYLLSAYDFSGFGSLVDVGGGEGLFLSTILSENPGLAGVLFDLPEVIERARARLVPELAARTTLVGGSFFEPLPAGHDAYLFKHILHDWDDDAARRILLAAREALASRAAGRLLVIEMVLPENALPHVGKLFDLEMLLSVSGRERTRSEFEQLFASAGLRLRRVVRTASPLSLLELALR